MDASAQALPKEEWRSSRVVSRAGGPQTNERHAYVHTAGFPQQAGRPEAATCSSSGSRAASRQRAAPSLSRRLSPPWSRATNDIHRQAGDPRVRQRIRQPPPAARSLRSWARMLESSHKRCISHSLPAASHTVRLWTLAEFGASPPTSRRSSTFSSRSRCARARQPPHLSLSAAHDAPARTCAARQHRRQERLGQDGAHAAAPSLLAPPRPPHRPRHPHAYLHTRPPSDVPFSLRHAPLTFVPPHTLSRAVCAADNHRVPKDGDDGRPPARLPRRPGLHQ